MVENVTESSGNKLGIQQPERQLTPPRVIRLSTRRQQGSILNTVRIIEDFKVHNNYKLQSLMEIYVMCSKINIRCINI